MALTLVQDISSQLHHPTTDPHNTEGLLHEGAPLRTTPPGSSSVTPHAVGRGPAPGGRCLTSVASTAASWADSASMRALRLASSCSQHATMATRYRCTAANRVQQGSCKA
jgi:hypothetical protein